jgi:hypothetical protein
LFEQGEVQPGATSDLDDGVAGSPA